MRGPQNRKNFTSSASAFPSPQSDDPFSLFEAKRTRTTRNFLFRWKVFKKEIASIGMDITSDQDNTGDSKATTKMSSSECVWKQ